MGPSSRPGHASCITVRFKYSNRAWDVALWSGVTPQGSADALDRLHHVGLVKCFRPERTGQARSFRLDRSYPLTAPLARLFEAEWAMRH